MIEDATKEIVRELFNVIRAIYPGFRQICPTQEEFNLMRREWLNGLIQHGVTSVEQINLGLKIARADNKSFPPSIGQFIEWCHSSSEDLGIPDIRIAFDEASKNSRPYSDKKWSHDVVYNAWLLTGSNAMANEPKDRIFPVFQKNYKIVIDRLISGEELKKYEEPKKLECLDNDNKELAKSHLSMLKDMLK